LRNELLLLFLLFYDGFFFPAVAALFLATGAGERGEDLRRRKDREEGAESEKREESEKN
jgi:hypothetical protein